MGKLISSLLFVELNFIQLLCKHALTRRIKQTVGCILHAWLYPFALMIKVRADFLLNVNCDVVQTQPKQVSVLDVGQSDTVASICMIVLLDDHCAFPVASARFANIALQLGIIILMLGFAYVVALN